MRSTLLLGIFLSVLATADPMKGDTAKFSFVKEDGTQQNWTFVVTDSDMRLFSAKVYLEQDGVTQDDLLLGSTPIMNRLMSLSSSDSACAAEGGAREELIIAGKKLMTCYVHSIEDGVTYDAWYANVPFGKAKLKILGGNRPGRYMVEPGEGILTSFNKN